MYDETGYETQMNERRVFSAVWADGMSRAAGADPGNYESSR
jgi:hypothetical protein